MYDDQEQLLVPNLEAFELWMRAGNYRPDTMSRALRLVKRYSLYCTERGIPQRNTDSITGFLASVAAGVRSPTLLNYYNDLKLAQRFLLDAGLTRRDYLAGVKRPRVSPYDREHDSPEYTEADIQRLLDVCVMGTWTGYRDRALLTILWTTPLRAGEICGLSTDDIDLTANEIRVRDGKGGVRYEVPLLPEFEDALIEYLSHCPYSKPYLWITTQGQQMTRETLRRVLVRLQVRARFTKQLAAHNFRHNYRMKLLAMGMSDADVSALMGHRSIQVTQSYGRKVARRLAKQRYFMMRGSPVVQIETLPHIEAASQLAG